MVISSPPHHQDVQQDLIAEIHRTSIWPVVVTVDGNINIPDETGFMDRNGSYVILTPDENIKSLKAEIIGLRQVGNEFTRFWNSEARFVVAGANKFSMLQQRYIFNFFSKFRMYNCIIVSSEHYVIDNEISRPLKFNAVDTGMKVGVYTWFPYQSSDRCTEVNDITLLDSWVISAQGHFTKNTDLFPSKFSNRLNGFPMKAFVDNVQSTLTTKYVKHTDSKGKVVKHVVGNEMKLLWIFKTDEYDVLSCP
jgi:hypothetical protein